MVHYTLILEGKYRLSIGRLSFPHTCDRAQQKQKSDILVYSNIFKLEINLDHMYYYSMGSIDFGEILEYQYCHTSGIKIVYQYCKDRFLFQIKLKCLKWFYFVNCKQLQQSQVPKWQNGHFKGYQNS